MQIKAIIHAAEEGGYWAEVPALPVCITEGETWEEVIAHLKDAISGWLEVANESRITEASQVCRSKSHRQTCVPSGENIESR